jgi:two-component system sensor histidine kinase KdpD
MAYLLAVLVAALGGRGPGLTAAVLSAACFDFFFVEPVHTFAVADRSFLITFAVMLATGIAIGSLVNRMRYCQDCAPWRFGTGHLARNLARRGLLA